jgi:predicted permease
MSPQSIVQDARFAARQLRRSPVSAFIVVLTLSLGIAANTAILSLVNAWLLHPLPLAQPQQLVSVWRTAVADPHQPAYFDPYHDYLIWASENHTLQSLAATFPQEYAITGSGEPQQIHGAIATWNLFATVGVGADAGRTFVADDVQGEPLCVISHALWQSRFGSSRTVIGQSVKLNGKPYRVLGVLPATFSLRVLDFPFDMDVWTLITAGDPFHLSNSPTPVSVIGRLKPRITRAQADADLNAIQRELNRLFSDEVPDSGVLVAGLQQDNTRTIRSSLLLLFGAVAVLLLIACTNAGSLVLGRNSRRATEFAVRLALGCSARRLLQQLTTEVLMLFVCGGLVGIAMAFALVRVFVATNPLGFLPPGGVSLDARVLGATAFLICLTALLFGSIPAIRALRLMDTEVLRTRATASHAHLQSRMAFVAVEIACSVVLLVSAGLLISSFAKIVSEPLGFQTSGVYVGDVALPLSRYATVDAQSRFVDHLLLRLRASPSVHAVGASTSWPFQANGLNPIEVEGRQGPQDQAPRAFDFNAGPGYFDALGIPLLRGRGFGETDRPGTPEVAVINDILARQYFPAEDPIGKRIGVGSLNPKEPNGPWLTVVGVVSNTRSVRYNHTDWDMQPAVYTAFLQRRDSKDELHRFDAQTIYIYLQAQRIETAMLSSSVHSIDPDIPVRPLRTTGEIVSGLRAQPRLRASVLGSFALLTLLLALIGVYGVMTQFVEQRRLEIGIRVALGAMAADVVIMVLRQSLLLIVPGLILGVVGAAAATRLLRGVLYEVSAFDPLSFAAVLIALPMVALVASYLPARRATQIDPSITLRSE